MAPAPSPPPAGYRALLAWTSTLGPGHLQYPTRQRRGAMERQQLSPYLRHLRCYATRARVEERFSAKAMVTGYEAIYQQVLASDDGASRVLGT